MNLLSPALRCEPWRLLTCHATCHRELNQQHAIGGKKTKTQADALVERDSMKHGQNKEAAINVHAHNQRLH